MKKLRKNKGFTLIELMIVVAIIAIIAAIAIPSLMRSRISANEAAAIGAMRTISSAQSSFQSSVALDADADGVGEYGTLAQLSATNPPYIDTALGTGTKGGYTFVTGALTETTYTVNADPITANTTGIRTFFLDQSGVIRQNPAGGAAATVASNPV